jgi:hypothetical protein
MKATLIRLTLERGASEFGLNRKTLASRIRIAGELPGEDGKFSIAQLARAIYSNYEAERTRLISEQADTARIKKNNLLRQNIPAELVERVVAGMMIELRQKILYAEIPAKVKTDLLRDLQAVPLDQYFLDAKTAQTDDEGHAEETATEK